MEQTQPESPVPYAKDFINLFTTFREILSFLEGLSIDTTGPMPSEEAAFMLDFGSVNGDLHFGLQLVFWEDGTLNISLLLIELLQTSTSEVMVKYRSNGEWIYSAQTQDPCLYLAELLPLFPKVDPPRGEDVPTRHVSRAEAFQIIRTMAVGFLKIKKKSEQATT
jgi:hypothetical protein